MSHRSRKAAQRFANKHSVAGLGDRSKPRVAPLAARTGAPGDRSEHQRPAPERGPVEVLGYDPVRDVACSIVGVPYGELYLDHYGSEHRTHDIMVGAPAPPDGSRRKDAFISTSQTFAEREARRKHSVAAENERFVRSGDQTIAPRDMSRSKTWTEGEGVDG